MTALKKLQGCVVLLIILSLTLPTLTSAAGLADLFGEKKVDEQQRTETIERIQSIQQKLKLLQDKLRVLERRKAAAAQGAEGSPTQAPAGQANWQGVDEMTTDPGSYGLYSYLLFSGEVTDVAAVGSLEDFILTIETLASSDIPPALGNRFLLPLERSQSLVKLARQPYDFKLNRAYLERLRLNHPLPSGPLLVSARQPIDPYATTDLPELLAVSLGRQQPQRVLELAELWQAQEVIAGADDSAVLSQLFWQLIDGAGDTTVVRDGSRAIVILPQP
jgi:hypothetical protein